MSRYRLAADGWRGAPIPDETVERWRTQFSFAEACRSLLAGFLEEFSAERGFFVVWGRGADASSESRPFRVMAAITADGTDIEDPDFYFERPNLRQIAADDRIELLDGVEAGVPRPRLSCSFPLVEGERGIVVLEAAPGSRAFQTSNATTILEQRRDSMAWDLKRFRLLECQETRLESQENRLRDLEAQLLRAHEQLREASGRPIEDERATEIATPTSVEEVVHYHGMITISPLMKELFKLLERIKDSDLRTLITGETGTGKELVARAIHFGGRRAAQPFEVVACGSLPTNLLESELFGYRKGAFSGAEQDRKGIFERGHGGTVFLDEVADMPPEMQQKILRVLQEKVIRPIGSETTVAIDVRVIASTRQDLERLVQERRFREDLYYRLNEMTVEVPSLRDRREDIPLLLNHFLTERSAEEGVAKRLSESARRELLQYSWPGNVQELRNLVTRAFIASSRRDISRRIIQPFLSRDSGNLFVGQDLYQEGDRLHLVVPYREGFGDIVSECERLVLLTALRRNRGNKSRVTQQLRMPRQTLYNKIEKFDIKDQDYMERE